MKRAPGGKAVRSRAQVELAQRGRGKRGGRSSSGGARSSSASGGASSSGLSRSAGAPSSSTFVPLGRGDFPSSLVVIFPLLLLYQLAIVVVPSVVASDPVSRVIYSAAGGRTGYLLVQALIAAIFLGWLHATGRTRTLSLAVIAPVVVEAAAIAALLWLALPLLLERALGLGVGTSIASALGAGLYEELIFRVLVLGVALQCFHALGLGRREAAVLAVIVAAASFAAAHHLGAAGEPFTTAAFAFRVTAGLALGAVLWFRSFAHAVYAHAIYDLLVLLTR